MMAFTSAKSRLMMPGTVMMSEMPCTAWRRMSSAMRNASKKLVPRSTVSIKRLFGLQHAAFAFEGKRFGDHRNGQCAEFAGQRSNDRSCSRAGASTKTGRDENHV